MLTWYTEYESGLHNKESHFDHEYNILKPHSKITKLSPNCDHLSRFGIPSAILKKLEYNLCCKIITSSHKYGIQNPWVKQ